MTDMILGGNVLSDNTPDGDPILLGGNRLTKQPSGGAGGVTVGIESALPTAATAGAGAQYFATDTRTLWISDGAAWQTLSQINNNAARDAGVTADINGGIAAIAATGQQVNLQGGNGDNSLQLLAGGRIQLTMYGETLVGDWPTADPHVAGGLWNNAGVLHVSAG